MRDYCFILTSPTGPEQLCRMGQFPDSDHAFCLAEQIASELGADPNGPWTGWTIEVQDSAGSLVFSIPVFSIPVCSVPVAARYGDDFGVGAVEIAATPRAA
jgi:hypothetical protein